MRVALFDLDETLLDGVSDLLWSEYLAERGEGDAEVVRGFHRDYQLGRLDLGKFLATYLDPFVRLEAGLLHDWREDWHATRAAPRVKPLGRALVERRRAEGFQGLGIDELIATRLERDGERYTGRIVGEPCFREGKIARVASWLEARGLGFDLPGETWFYSDSHNDLPLLSRVSHPVCVDPDARLAAIAAERGWPVLSLRAPESAAT
jgi:phosphoserine phosphatase